jgi:hypothetical protein
MKEIRLTQGKMALVDDEDFDLLNQVKWHADKYPNTYYARRMVWIGEKRVCQRMHHLILEVPPHMEIDHIDGNGLNNQKLNLRVVTSRQNHQNIHTPKTSYYPGVHWDSCQKRWISKIRYNGRQRFLLQTPVEEDAATAYRVAAEVLT